MCSCNANFSNIYIASPLLRCADKKNVYVKHSCLIKE